MIEKKKLRAKYPLDILPKASLLLLQSRNHLSFLMPLKMIIDLNMQFYK